MEYEVFDVATIITSTSKQFFSAMWWRFLFFFDRGWWCIFLRSQDHLVSSIVARNSYLVQSTVRNLRVNRYIASCSSISMAARELWSTIPWAMSILSGKYNIFILIINWDQWIEKWLSRQDHVTLLNIKAAMVTQSLKLNNILLFLTSMCAKMLINFCG